MTDRLRPLAIAAAIFASAGRLSSQATRPAINLITRNEIEIAGGAATIWPDIIDPSRWKQGLKLVHQSGPAGGLHEILAAIDRDPAHPAFLVENVELAPNRRRTIKLWLPDGSLIGFASWSLVESADGRRTTVRYEVYSETRGEGTSPADLREAEEREQATNSTRFDAELAALKALIERPRTRS